MPVININQDFKCYECGLVWRVDAESNRPEVCPECGRDVIGAFEVEADKVVAPTQKSIALVHLMDSTPVDLANCDSVDFTLENGRVINVSFRNAGIEVRETTRSRLVVEPVSANVIIVETGDL